MLNKTMLKSILVMLVQIVLMTILAIIILAFTGIDTKINPYIENIITIVIFTVSLHIALILSTRKIKPDDKNISSWLATVYASYYLAMFLYLKDAGDLLLMVEYSAVAFLYTKWFVDKKLKKSKL